MKITDIIVETVVAEKQRTQAQRSAEKCWPGKHKEGTKPSPTHPGIRVNNCVPNEGMMEEEIEAWDKPGYDLIVMDYYNSGNTPSEIAQQLGIDEEEVEYIIYKHENGLAEAGSPAQQAAIAINMKKHHQKPKHTDEDAEAQFDRIEEMVEQLAEQYGVDSEAVWDLLEDHSDEDLLTETAAWHRKAGKNKNGGLNRKGVMSYRREHPGSKLQTAVTTKPSKLKPGSKAAKRRKSFCARMSGVKGPMKKPNGKPTRKALALRKWNC